MKKSILTLSLLLFTLSAGAWNKLSLPAITALTAQHLTPEAALATKAALGTDFAECNITDRPKYLFHLDEEYSPVCEGQNDALLVIGEAVERLNKNKGDKEAILSLARAVADMHSVANVRIKGNDMSYNDFTVRRWNNRNGKMARYKDCGWRFLWNSYYAYKHAILTAELYAEDINLYHINRLDDFQKGTPAEWAKDMAAESRVIYSRELKDNYVLSQEDVNYWAFTHDRLLAKASYRLAAILNQIFK
ncbi:MAG: hypothetical protein IKY24_05585 [Alistipes sp.]|nr:hypothetical protein [Alistipes sp.]